MKKTYICILAVMLTGCFSLFLPPEKCKEAGGLMYKGFCETDKSSNSYKLAVRENERAKAKCVNSLNTWTYVTDADDNDAVVMEKNGYNTWIIEDVGTGYATGRYYGMGYDSDYCYADTGYVNNLYHYPIAKKIKWKK